MNERPDPISFDLDLKQIVEDLPLSAIIEGVHVPGYEHRLGYYQYTHTGGIFFACDPLPEEVFIKDIAIGASRICRFNSQTEHFLSVAEHCWLASYLVPRPLALEALLHDCAESYINDMVRPLKATPLIGQVYLKIERTIEKVVAQRYRLTYPWPREVMVADDLLAHAERGRNIKSREGIGHYNPKLYDPQKQTEHLTTPLHFWRAELAEAYFLERFRELATERGIDLEKA